MLFTGLLILLLRLVDSHGKALESMESSGNGILRTSDGIEQGRNIKENEVEGIESRFGQQRYHGRDEKNKANKIPIQKRSKRCFCPFSTSCPDGFVRTHPQWPCTRILMASTGLPAPLYSIGDEWPWFQGSFDGNQAGSQFDTSPCGQFGWCCCEEEKQNDKAPDVKKPLTDTPQHKQADSSRLIINVV